MKKAMKKLMAALLAVAMLCAMAVPAFAEKGTQTVDISNHSFKAYQIFTATVTDADATGGKVSNVEWGSSVNATELLNELSSDVAFEGAFNTGMTAADVVKAMSGWAATDAKTAAFAKDVAKHLGTEYTSSSSNTIDFSEPGYYLIVDTTATTGKDDAKNLNLLNVTAAGNVTVRAKVVKPTVDKFVQDNDDGAYAGSGENDGFGKTADHEIGKSFQFKLVANLPVNEHYSDYEHYKIVFHDTMSKGITFENIARVVIKQSGVETPINDYVVAGISDGQKGEVKDWTVTIADAKNYQVDLTDGATIEVYYNAHLNEEAYVNTASGTTENKNTVKLEYSNNPNADGTGMTPEETVYVFTYEIDNTKYKDSIGAGNELAGAGFKLYKDAGCTEEVKLAKDAASGYYMPTSGTGEEMHSGNDGKFNIKGLDAGIYYLRETTTPQGYNTCADVEIKIFADHQRNAMDIGKVDLTGSYGMQNEIINKSGTVLPSTGGIGTTIFYVVGGGLMIAAAVLLITKKRMENKN